MISIGEYRIDEKLFESSNTLVCRASPVNGVDTHSVIIKFLQDEFPSPEALARFRSEYELQTKLNSSYVVKAKEMFRYKNSQAIVLEDFGGESLGGLLEDGPVSFDDFCIIARKLLNCVEYIHQNNVVHKDINPSNIIWRDDTQELKLIDFGISTELSLESSDVPISQGLKGTLAYISPEQTGRMNRALDYRTDYYSIGVTLYQLLTGQLPLNATDPIEWVHAHIARTPRSAYEVNAAIPRALSDVIDKLMCKHAEERYLTVSGIRRDLEYCEKAFRRTGDIPRFSLGVNDYPKSFQISNKLVGRSKEYHSLLSAFETINCGDKALVSILGESGVGKTSLVKEIQRPVVTSRGYFAEGKFDQYDRTTPYSALIMAFSQLIKQVLVESDAELSLWRERLSTALEQNGQLVVEVLPELESLIGPQPSLREVSNDEMQNRFHRTFSRFAQSFCSTTHPVVVFLDDIQWADLSSLRLISEIFQEDGIDHFMLVLAYRNEDVTAAHPASQTIQEIQSSGTNNREIVLNPLTMNDLSEILANSMNCDASHCQSLAKLTFDKTAGNPFYFSRFVEMLGKEGHISFDPQLSQWTWDLAKITLSDSTDNVIDLMVSKLCDLPQDVVQLVKVSATIGVEFDVFTLANVVDDSISNVAERLLEAIKAGFLLPQTDAYQWMQFLLEDTDDQEEELDLDMVPDSMIDIENSSYRFAHDRIQQAAYSIVSEDELANWHHKIGKVLAENLAKTPENHRLVFEIVSHFNKTTEQFRKLEDRVGLVELNIRAAKYAKERAAFEQYCNYSSVASDLLDTSMLEFNPGLYFEARLVNADSAYLNARYEQMLSQLDDVISHSKETLTLLSAYKIHILALVAQHQASEAVAKGLQALQLVNVNLKAAPTEEDVAEALINTLSELGPDPAEMLIKLPELQNPNMREAMTILNLISSPSYQSNPQLFPIIVCSMVLLSKDHGNSAASSFAYATFGLILCGALDNTALGNKFGELATNLGHLQKQGEVDAKTHYVIDVFINHWNHSLEDSVAALKQNYQFALTCGDFEYACWSGMMEQVHSFMLGKPLAELSKVALEYKTMMERVGQKTAIAHFSIYMQAIDFLQNKVEDPDVLAGQFYTDSEMVHVHSKANDHTALAILFYFKLVTCFFYQQPKKAMVAAESLFGFLGGVVSSAYVPQFAFYDALNRLSMLFYSEEDERKQHLKQVKEHSENLNKWAEDSAANYHGKALLVKAELLRVESPFSLELIYVYEQAINHAKEFGLLSDEALGNECLGKFWLQYEKPEIAQLYLKKAVHLYDLWGCTIKRDILKSDFNWLFEQYSHEDKTVTESDSLGSTVFKHTVAKNLDLTSVMKASQAISSEIIQEKLLHTMMLLVLENAGAQKGCLLLEKGGAWSIEAEANMDETDVVSIASKAFNFRQAYILPISILQLVRRTKEPLVLDDAYGCGRFAQDAYIEQLKPKSILCVPILNRGQVSGLIYLENNLLSNAFTPERVETIRLLVSQTAISLENASLYADLEKRVAERTHKLNEANQELIRLAAVDSLTGANNRRHFMQLSSAELARAKDNKGKVLVAMLDLDHFKSVNDNYGHAAGDEALKIAVDICKNTLNATDVFGRMGGEEFAIFMPDTTVQEGMQRLEHIRASLETTIIEIPPHEFSVTSSIGAVYCDDATETIEQLLHFADEALYDAKKSGRNSIKLSNGIGR